MDSDMDILHAPETIETFFILILETSSNHKPRSIPTTPTACRSISPGHIASEEPTHKCSEWEHMYSTVVPYAVRCHTEGAGHGRLSEMCPGPYSLLGYFHARFCSHHPFPMIFCVRCWGMWFEDLVWGNSMHPFLNASFVPHLHYSTIRLSNNRKYLGVTVLDHRILSTLHVELLLLVPFWHLRHWKQYWKCKQDPGTTEAVACRTSNFVKP